MILTKAVNPVCLIDSIKMQQSIERKEGVRIWETESLSTEELF